MLVARGAALHFNEGRPMHISDDQTIFLTLGNGRLFGVIQVPVIVMLALFLITAVLLHRTSFGQHLYAIGGNRQAAKFTRHIRERARNHCVYNMLKPGGDSRYDPCLSALFRRAGFRSYVRIKRHCRSGCRRIPASPAAGALCMAP